MRSTASAAPFLGALRASSSGHSWRLRGRCSPMRRRRTSPRLRSRCWCLPPTSCGRCVAAGAGGPAAGLAVIGVLMGPQIARTDLRQDLRHLDVLKTWPIRSSALIRGEMLWPAALLTAVAWGAILCAMILWSPGFAAPTLAWRISIALAAAIIAPAFVFAQFTIHNAAAVLFPAWVPLGTSRPRGVDAMGQRLIMFAGILIGLVAMIAPGAIAGGLIWFAFQRFGGAFVLLPAAAACAA